MIAVCVEEKGWLLSAWGFEGGSLDRPHSERCKAVGIAYPLYRPRFSPGWMAIRIPIVIRTWSRSYPKLRVYMATFVFVWCVLVDGFQETGTWLEWLDRGICLAGITGFKPGAMKRVRSPQGFALI